MSTSISSEFKSTSDDRGPEEDEETEDGELIGQEDDDTWDDTLLIQSYEESTKLVDEKIKEIIAKGAKKKSNRNRGKKRSSHSLENGIENDFCSTKSDERTDGASLVKQNSIMEVSSKEKSDEMAPITQVNQNTPQALPQNAPQLFSPPPPAFLNPSDALGKDEQLSSMLMSWYMCGYHTGYYAALKQVNKNG